MRYRRSTAKGATYFFTLNLASRQTNLLIRHIAALRKSLQVVTTGHPFSLLAMVVLPDHLHAVWRLPSDDANLHYAGP